MGEPDLKLARAPIVEAVIDIECDMPPAFDLAALQVSAHEPFRDRNLFGGDCNLERVRAPQQRRFA